MRARVGHAAGFCLAVVFVTLLVAPAVEASPIIFTDRSLFEAVVQPNVLATFDSAEVRPGAPFCQVNNTCSALIDNVLQVSWSDFVAFSDVFNGNLDMFGSSLNFGYVDLSLGKFDLPSTPFTAIGFDVSASSTQLLDIGGGLFPPSPGFQTSYSFLSPPGFIGLLFPAPVYGIRLSVLAGPENSPLIVDNMSLKTVPEPATLLLLSSGMVLMQAGRLAAQRRMRSKTARAESAV